MKFKTEKENLGIFPEDIQAILLFLISFQILEIFSSNNIELE